MTSRNLLTLSTLWATLIVISGGTVSAMPALEENGLFSGDPVGVSNLIGREIIPPNYSKIEYCGNGFFLATGINPSDKYWFCRFLTDYNLIGMHRAEVDRLLSPNEDQSTIPSDGYLSFDIGQGSSCMPTDAPSLLSPISLKIRFKDDAVTGWCFSRSGVDSPMYRQSRECQVS